MAPYEIRVIGDPVLTQRANEVDDIDGRVARLVDDMFTTMYDAPGLGLAAPQVGVQKRIFVFDDQDGLKGVLVNPEIRESRGEWEHQEGCLSIPGLYFDIVRPKEILLAGRDLDGNEVEIEADEMVARIFQHELDHLDGVLMVERLDDDQRKQAKRAVREFQLQRSGSQAPEPSAAGGLRLP
jgi:peptide deformylase